MKKILFAVIALACNALGAMAMGVAPYIGVGAGVVFTLLKAKGLNMAVTVEIWENDIVGALFADNSFLSKAYNADQYVLAGKVVHINKAGAASTVVKNRSSFPGTATRRTDSDVTYSLDEYTTDPRHIQDAENVEVNYNKRQSVLSEDKAALQNSVAEEFIYKWSPTAAAQILRTTGEAVAAHLPSATGNRKKFTRQDVRSANKLLNKNNIPETGRYCLVDAEMHDQLLESLTETQVNAFLGSANPATGSIGKLYGFEFYMRSKAAVYTNASTPAPKYLTDAGAATDNAGAIFWQENCTERALGTVKMFENTADPLYYGDIYSFLCRAGGRIRRDEGVVVCVQAATT